MQNLSALNWSISYGMDTFMHIFYSRICDVSYLEDILSCLAALTIMLGLLTKEYLIICLEDYLEWKNIQNGILIGRRDWLAKKGVMDE